LPPPRIIDAGNRIVIPGLIDSHIHAIRAGLSYATEVHWTGATTITEALQRLRNAAGATFNSTNCTVVTRLSRVRCETPPGSGGGLEVALLWASVRTTQGWLRVMLATAAMAGGLQAIRATVAGRSSDITEPILALVAAGTLLLASHLAHRAVQACCRRKQSAPVAVERRRRDHRYGSAADRKPQPADAAPVTASANTPDTVPPAPSAAATQI
jgi:hypothetical protein